MIAADPEQWLSISRIARIYKDECDAAVGRIAERRVLSPLGLTRSEFLSRQREMSPELVTQLAQELLSFQASPVEAIVSGVDSTGPHIFVVTNTTFECLDTVGFAAIGSGANHANSQMMAFSHTYRHSIADTLMSVLFSKKRAEIAPGVGETTDMWIVTGLGAIDLLNDDLKKQLERLYAAEKLRQQRVANRSRQEVHAVVQQVIAGSAKRNQSELPSSIDDSSSPDEATTEG